MAFSPASVTVGLGERVTWTFQDATAHTSTSDQGFWNSGTKSGGATYSRAFTSAGTFAYHCTIHPMMRGKVRVPVDGDRVRRNAGWKLRWSTKKGKGGVTLRRPDPARLGEVEAARSPASTAASKKFNPAQGRATTRCGPAR